jgi:hypothetical protein
MLWVASNALSVHEPGAKRRVGRRPVWAVAVDGLLSDVALCFKLFLFAVISRILITNGFACVLGRTKLENTVETKLRKGCFVLPNRVKIRTFTSDPIGADPVNLHIVYG